MASSGIEGDGTPQLTFWLLAYIVLVPNLLAAMYGPPGHGREKVTGAMRSMVFCSLVPAMLIAEDLATLAACMIVYCVWDMLCCIDAGAPRLDNLVHHSLSVFLCAMALVDDDVYGVMMEVGAAFFSAELSTVFLNMMILTKRGTPENKLASKMFAVTFVALRCIMFPALASSIQADLCVTLALWALILMQFVWAFFIFRRIEF